MPRHFLPASSSGNLVSETVARDTGGTKRFDLRLRIGPGTVEVD